MVVEVVDPGSGAILFKKDKETLKVEELSARVKDLEDIVSDLQEKIKYLMNK